MKKVSSIVLVVLSFVAWAALDLVSAQTTISVEVAPFLVAGGDSHQVDSHLSGSLIVFTNRSTAGSVIRYRDLADPASEVHTVPGGAWFDTSPEVSGTQVVFNRRGWDATTGATISAIMLFDAANPSAPIEISPAPPGVHRAYPAIGGDTVAFTQYDGFSAEVCVSSLTDLLAPETCLTSDSPSARNEFAAVSPDGNVVVWQKWAPNVGYDIYMAYRNADSTWSAPQLLSDSSGADHYPDTDGRFVTWMSVRWNSETSSSEYAIYYVDLTGTAGAQAITVADAGDEQYPHIEDGMIVFELHSADPYDSDVDIHLIDLSTNAHAVVRATPALEFLADVSRDASGKVWLTWSQRVGEQDNLDVDVWAMRIDLQSPSYIVQPLFNQSRSYKAGSVVPIRLQVLDGAGVNVSSASLVLTATAVVQKDSTADPLVVEDAGNANADSAFRYDGTLQGYVFNLSTKNLTAGTWELRFIVAGDSREYAVTFDVR